MRHVLAAALFSLVFVAPARAEGTEYVLEILELHEKLATNELFQQQAKLLGAYMLEAQAMDHDNRVRTYQTVLRILRLIDNAPATRDATPPAPPEKPAAPAAPSDSKPATETPAATLDSGAAQVEWFNTGSLDEMPDAPVRRALWKRDLFAMGAEDDRDLPKQAETPAAARITFYLEAKVAGEHSFAAQHADCRMRVLVGGKPVVDLKGDGKRSGQDKMHLEQGFHRVDVLLLYGKDERPSFAVSVLPPGEAESHVLSKSELMLKRPAPPVTQ
jgi:hypothetical protein